MLKRLIFRIYQVFLIILNLSLVCIWIPIGIILSLFDKICSEAANELIWITKELDNG